MSAVAAPYAVRPGRERSIVTPDGVRLTVRIADLSSRIAAALLDLTIILLTMVLLVVLLVVFFGYSSRSFDDSGGSFRLALDLVILSIFLTRVFYFPFFEMNWSGRTPGKRALGIRVMDRNGSGLTGEAVLARNLVREIEFFLPVMTIIAQPDLTGHTWANLAAYAFILLIISLPLLNKERMRGGDILAGTWVVYDEKPALLPDLATAGEETFGYNFTDAQLRTYGLKELETLAAVLREKGANGEALRRKVTATIQQKIGYEAAPGEKDEDFLRAFYAALRGALERRKATTGYAPEDKHVAPTGSADRRFTTAQLEVYGAQQLETLGKLLREEGPDAIKRRAEVAKQIRTKIGAAESPGESPESFLRAFYAALKRHVDAQTRS